MWPATHVKTGLTKHNKPETHSIIMAKKSQRRPVQYDKEQLGCMWGFIHMFDFRHVGSTQKMISDSRRGRRHAVGAGYSAGKLKMLTNFDENGQHIDDGNENTAGIAAGGKTSVKKLIEDEMCGEPDPKQQISSAEVEEKQSESGPGRQSRKNSKRANRNRKKSNEININDMNTTEDLGTEKNTSNLNMAAIMEELCSQIQQKSVSFSELDQQDELNMKTEQKHSDFEDKLSEATKMFINQKFVSREDLSGDGKFYHSKEFMDALQTLISNKDLFMKLLQDPNSLLMKHIQNLKDIMAEKHEKSMSISGSNFSTEEISDTKQSEDPDRKQRNFFRRKMKSPQRKSSKVNESPQASKTIVILKPGPSGLQDSEMERGFGSLPQSHHIMRNNSLGERSSSHFSFTEIKRKLKHAMGKEPPGVPPVGLSHRIPCDNQNSDHGDKRIGGENMERNSPSRNLFYDEKFPKPSPSIKNVKKTGKTGSCEISMENGSDGYPRQRVSNIYIEAKKHLSEMLTNGDEEDDCSSKQVPKTLGRILSLPEYNSSPIFSPGRDWEHGFVTAKMRFSDNDNFRRLNESTLQLKQENSGSSEDKVEAPKANQQISDELINDVAGEISSASRDNTSSEGDVEVVAITDKVLQEDSNVLDSEPTSSSITQDDQNGDTPEICGAGRTPKCIRLDLFQECQPSSSPLASPSSSPTTSKAQYLESVVDKTDRPSPVSVLEPLFAEDDISPASSKLHPAEPPMAPLRIRFEEQDSCARDEGSLMKTHMDDLESIFEYCKTVLQASGMCWDEFYKKSLSSDQLLDLSLFDEVVFFPNQLCHDQQLLFDCINEVLMEIFEHYFGCSLWVSFVKPNIRPVPNVENSIHEVWQGVEWHLTPQLPPRTLDQIIAKDLAKNGIWMDLRFDTESLGAEMGKVILDELMEDTICSCMEESVESKFSALSPELEENQITII